MSGPMRGPGGRRPGMEKPRDMGAAMKRLFQFMSPFRVSLVLVVLFVLLSTLLSSIGPTVLGLATNEIQRGFQRMQAGTGGIDFGAIVRILTLLGVLYGVSALFEYLQHFTIAGVSQKTMYALRRAVDEKIKKLPLSYYDGHSIGDILSRVTNDVDTVASSLQQGINQVFSSIFTLIFTLVMMLRLSPWLTLVTLLTLPLTLVCSMGVVKTSQALFKGQMNTLGDLNGYAEETYTGHQVVQAFSREKQTNKTFDDINETLYGYSWKANFISSVIMPISGFFGNLGYILVTIIGAFQCLNGTMLVGSIQSFTQYIRQFNQPVTQAAQLTNMLQATIAAAERVFAFLDEEEERPDVEDALVPALDRGEVRFEHVSFGYSPDKILMKDLNLEIHPGETVAIVGPTGAGKTTLVNLILRFYEVQHGRVLIDGVDITQMTRTHLRSCIGMVLQDTWLFSGTILENIRYGRLDAADEEVYAAARADDFIRSQPDGYHTDLGEDAANISQGQRQLLTIARAILSDPEILILDEATSSVDTRTEVLIQKAMHTLMKNRTSFVIAHRLSTIRDADKILVMDHGDIIEAGSHRELMALGGFYSKLYQSQFQEGDTP